MASNKLAAGLAVYVLVGAGPDGGRSPLTVAKAALAGGATAIQLRIKDDTPIREQVALGEQMAALCREAGALFFVNDRLDIALAAGADGLHVGQDDLPVATARRLTPPGFIIGCSVDNPRQAKAAAAAGADYLGVGPIYGTSSKDDAGAAVGPDHLRRVAAATSLPLVGIGGITATGAEAVIAAGAAGVAVISAVTAAPDIAAATARLARAVAAARKDFESAAAPRARPAVAGGEFGLIQRLAEKLPRPQSTLVGIGDDAAVLPDAAGNPALVMTCDLLVEDIHFRQSTTPPRQLGWKSLAVNVSDSAAMGARPRWAVVSLAIPPHWSEAALTELYEGLARAARHWHVDIVGGDTSRAPDALTIGVTVIGQLAAAPVLRQGARPGDLIAVTGQLGTAAAGLALAEAARAQSLPRSLDEKAAAFCRQAWLQPEPPVTTGVSLAAAGLPTAMIDVSDGLTQDLNHLLQPQALGARLHLEQIPVAPAARQVAAALGADAEKWALQGGEDFQLLFTLPSAAKEKATAILDEKAVAWSIIGVIEEAPGLRLVDSSGQEATMQPSGWDHLNQ